MSRHVIRARALVVLVVLVVTLPACAGNSSADDVDAAAPDLVVGDPVGAGKKLVERYGCGGCHDPGNHTLSGRLVPIGKLDLEGSRDLP